MFSGMWATNNCHQLHAICYQRLYESEQRFLRSCYKAFERQRNKDGKQQIEADEQFWKTWNDSGAHYVSIGKSLRIGHSKLSEEILRQRFPQTWKARQFWGADRVADDGVIGARYRLPLGVGSSVAEAVGFALSILKEFVIERGIDYSLSDL